MAEGDRNDFRKILSLGTRTSTPKGKSNSSENAKKRSRPSSDCDLCPQCETQIREGTEYLVCVHCGLSFCRNCTSISKEQFKLITTPGLNLSLTCPTCKYTLPTLLRLDSSVAEIKKTNNERLTKLELNVAEIDIKLDKKIEQETKAKIDSLKDEITDKMVNELNEKIDLRVKEIDARKRRSQNLMIYNLPESKDDNSDQRQEFDKNLINEIASSLDVKLDDFKGYRIGIRSTDKIRPLKIVFDNKRNRRDFLSQAKHIRLKAPDKLKKTIITADMTPAQREERKTLLRELEQVRLKHKGAKIRDNKIIIPNVASDLINSKQKKNEKPGNKKPKTNENEEDENYQKLMYQTDDTMINHMDDTVVDPENHSSWRLSSIY